MNKMRPLLISGNIKSKGKYNNFIENIKKTYDNELKQIVTIITLRNDR
jgi:hypothetical protein